MLARPSPLPRHFFADSINGSGFLCLLALSTQHKSARNTVPSCISIRSISCSVVKAHRFTLRKRYPHRRWLNPRAVGSPARPPRQLGVPPLFDEETLPLELLNGLVIGLFRLCVHACTGRIQEKKKENTKVKRKYSTYLSNVWRSRHR